MQEKIEELERQIAELKKKQADKEKQQLEISNWKTSVYKLDSFSDEEKIKVFNKLYRHAYNYLDDWVESAIEPKDSEYYAYEALMTSMLGPEHWRIIRMLTN